MRVKVSVRVRTGRDRVWVRLKMECKLCRVGLIVGRCCTCPRAMMVESIHTHPTLVAVGSRRWTIQLYGVLIGVG